MREHQTSVQNFGAQNRPRGLRIVLVTLWPLDTIDNSGGISWARHALPLLPQHHSGEERKL